MPSEHSEVAYVSKTQHPLPTGYMVGLLSEWPCVRFPCVSFFDMHFCTLAHRLHNPPIKVLWRACSRTGHTREGEILRLFLHCCGGRGIVAPI